LIKFVTIKEKTNAQDVGGIFRCEYCLENYTRTKRSKRWMER